MVLDIRDFTIFPRTSCGGGGAALKHAWEFMVQTVNDHHGIVNKFLGDGFLAVFGAPLPSENNSSNAMRPHTASSRSSMSCCGRGVAPTEIGIALHSGEAIVGNVGSADRKEYTVIGDVVNVAFRIEALNREFKSAAHLRYRTPLG
jgi:adenylate cyclase